MNYNEFFIKYKGQSKGYPEGKYPGECLSIVKLYIKECFNIEPPPSGNGSAYGYWSNFPSPLGTVFEKIENTDTSFPLPGDIVIWQPWSTNQYGHIAICKSGDVNKFSSYDQNWGTKNFVEITHNYDNVCGYLRGKSIIDDMTDEQKRILDFLAGKTEGDVRQAFGALADLDIKNKQIQDLQANVVSLNKIVNDLKDRMTALESNIQADLNLIEDWQQRCTTAKKQLDDANKQIADITVDRNKYKNYYETKCDELKKLDKLTAWQHIKLGISMLTVKK
jgi:hypothetical protein